MLRLLALLLAMSFPRAAQAQSASRPALHWSRSGAAAHCIDPRSLALRVTALTGPVLVDAAAADLSIEGHVSRDRAGVFEVRLTATGSDGVQRGDRHLEQRGDCRELDTALALMIALLIDPDLTSSYLPAEIAALGAEGAAPEVTLLRELEAEPPRPFVALAAPHPPTPAAQTEPSTAPAVEGPLRARWTLRAGASLGLGELRGLPGTTLGPFLAVAVMRRHWLAIEALLRGVSLTRPLRLDGGHELRAQSFAAGLLACPRSLGAAWFGELCAGPELGLARARGRGFSEDQVAHRLELSGLVAAGLGLRVRGPWELLVRGTARWLFNRPSFSYHQVDGEQLALSLARLSGELSVGLGRAFGSGK